MSTTTSPCLCKSQAGIIKSDHQPKTVLLVDNEDSLLNAVGHYLNERGFRVRTSSSAVDALAAVKAEPPHVLVTDTMLQSVDGYQLLLQLRSYPEFALLPVVFLTSLDTAQARIHGHACGANAWITKPFDPEELVAAINNAICRDRLYRSKANSMDDELVEPNGRFGSWSSSM